MPGSWINSVQVSKGTGSVVNGYESMTGQINLDWKKPGNAEKLHLNLFGNQAGRMELNLNLSRSCFEKVGIHAVDAWEIPSFRNR